MMASAPASAKATICASFARNRAWVGLEKSGACGSAPLCARRLHARSLGAGYGMTRHESRRQRTEDASGRLQHDALGARHIGDDHELGQGFFHRLHRAQDKTVLVQFLRAFGVLEFFV